MSIKLDYIKVGDYYLPNLILDEPPEFRRFIGKYADLRREYLKEHQLALWMVLVNSGTALTHLREIEDAANARLDALLPVLAKNAGATEALKASDPLKWVGLMNACKAQAEEIIFAELIYN
ncbi:MAG: TnpV protein [Oscillospiraceae bacterium]|nr:TnpV protein [Oscillospiraceae bacterium]